MLSKRIDFLFLLIILFSNFIIFHNILLNCLDVVEGEKIIAREELIPFFDFTDDYLSNIFSNYDDTTSGIEIRAEYFFITSWVRYYKFLPFMLLILNSVSWFLIYYSLIILTKNSVWDKLSSFVAASLIYIFLIVSKITSFYSLIFGFALFCFSLSLFMYCLQNKKFNLKYILLISFLVLINPGIHFHVLFIFASSTLFVLITFINHKNHWQKSASFFLVIIFSSTFLYVLWIYPTLIPPYPSINIPVTESFLKHSSLSEIDSFSLNGLAPFFNYFYDVSTYRYSGSHQYIFIIIPIIALLALLSKSNKFLLPISFLFVISFLLATNFFDIYIIIFSILNTVSLHLGFFGEILLSAFKVIRLPHRFQFLMWYSLAILASVSLSNISKKSKFIFFAVIVILLIPFLFSEYFNILISGDMHGFLPIFDWNKAELDQIKPLLTNEGKAVILPSSLYDARYSSNDYFLNKVFMYYLNYSFIDYSAASDIQNKNILNSIVYETRDRTRQNISTTFCKYGIGYVVRIKDLEGPNHFDNLWNKLKSDPNVTMSFLGKDYELYEVRGCDYSQIEISDICFEDYIALSTNVPIYDISNSKNHVPDCYYASNISELFMAQFLYMEASDKRLPNIADNSQNTIFFNGYSLTRNLNYRLYHLLSDETFNFGNYNTITFDQVLIKNSGFQNYYFRSQKNDLLLIRYYSPDEYIQIQLGDKEYIIQNSQNPECSKYHFFTLPLEKNAQYHLSISPSSSFVVVDGVYVLNNNDMVKSMEILKIQTKFC